MDQAIQLMWHLIVGDTLFFSSVFLLPSSEAHMLELYLILLYSEIPNFGELISALDYKLNFDHETTWTKVAQWCVFKTVELFALSVMLVHFEKL